MRSSTGPEGITRDPRGIVEPKAEGHALEGLAEDVSRLKGAFGVAHAIWEVHLYEGALEAY